MLLGSRSNTSLEASPSNLRRPLTQAGGDYRQGAEYEKQMIRPKTQQAYMGGSPGGEMGIKPIRIGVPKLSKKEIVFGGHTQYFVIQGGGVC